MKRYIEALLQYGIEKNLLDPRDLIYTRNQLLDLLQMEGYDPASVTPVNASLEEILKALLDDAAERGLLKENTITYRDLFDTRIMGLLTPAPSAVIDRFNALYQESPEKATDYFYDFSCNTDYIRRYRIEKDMKWKTATPYGELDITVNLSKPEKDPKAIAAAKNAPPAVYPKCLLCKENEGFAGSLTAPPRQNHRILPLTLNGEEWSMQYSPYVYYNEHCILLNNAHTPMKINAATFRKFFDFLEIFPHYTVGSNADLPIVGGSILSHDHFQGGHYIFPMERAPFEETFTFNRFPEVKAGIVRWPLSVLRLQCADRQKLCALAEEILAAWRGYTDEQAFIFAQTDGEPHNTITPIARMRDGEFELDLVLRNNITTEEHPLGVYHPHAELHHIKKENIGLIEVMGLAVLPARLKGELELLADQLIKGVSPAAHPDTEKHTEWIEKVKAGHPELNEKNVMSILQEEVGLVFSRVLEDAGVYKCDEEGRAAFMRFIRSIGIK
ncbi:MAG: UDP-glucose--hexose-1-phosphate uridylyltransferase [Clostridia bacterium]|nr:UDP-glucose--hexose-1-phosphate uridylyltransferase [Clostridia bacterium]